MDQSADPKPVATVINRRIADMLAANLDEPRYNALMVFHMPSGGKVAAVLVGDKHEDVESIHQYLARFEEAGTGESWPRLSPEHNQAIIRSIFVPSSLRGQKKGRLAKSSRDSTSNRRGVGL